jgi:class 3 adenylate cyclase
MNVVSTSNVARMQLLESFAFSSVGTLNDAFEHQLLDPEAIDPQVLFTQMRLINEASRVQSLFFGDENGAFFLYGRAQDRWRWSIAPYYGNATRKEFNVSYTEPTWGAERVENRVVYDPRIRPWYTSAKELAKNITAKDELSGVWTDVYAFASGGYLGVTFAIPVFNDAMEFVGVIGADLTLSSVQTWINQETTRRLVIFDDKATLIAASDEDIPLSQPSKEDPDQVTSISATETEHYPTCAVFFTVDTVTGTIDRIAEDDMLSSETIEVTLTSYWPEGSTEDACAVSTEEREVEGVEFVVHVRQLYRDPMETANSPTSVLYQAPEVGSYTSVILRQQGAFLQWTLIIYEPRDIFFAAVMENRQKAAASTTGLVLVGVVIAIGIASLISRPFAVLKKNVERLAELDFSNMDTHFFSGFQEVYAIKQSLAVANAALQSFGRFVPPAVVRRIVRREAGADTVHVEERNAAILFSDIEGFTSFSEQLNLDDLLIVLSKYYSEMQELVEATEGCVAEILGDGLLCFWNADQDVDQYTTRALECALLMQESLTVVNEFIRDALDGEQSSVPELRVRIGIHTGAVLAGNIGAAERMKWGGLGDRVNAASRLENSCKFFYTRMLITQEVFDEAGGATATWFAARPLLEICFVGKSQPLKVYEVLGRKTRETKRTAHRFTSLMNKWYEGAPVSQCVSLLRHWMRLHPSDKTAGRVLEWAETLVNDGLDDATTTQRIFTMNSK